MKVMDTTTTKETATEVAEATTAEATTTEATATATEIKKERTLRDEIRYFAIDVDYIYLNSARKR